MSLSDYSYINPSYVEFQPLKEGEKAFPGQIGTCSFLAFSDRGMLRYSNIGVYRDGEGRISVGVPGVSYKTQDDTIVTRFPLREGTKFNIEQQVEAVLQERLK